MTKKSVPFYDASLPAPAAPAVIPQAMLVWLFACFLCVFAIILVGAITRLTESGLSMVEWRAMIDMLPPLSHDAWMSEFEKYRQTPEYLQINRGMSLEDFKTIYFWEWLHRLLGRLAGLLYAVPLAWFWLRGQVPPRLKIPFLGFLFLGGLQGFFGWFMVKSGLVNEPRVSHYRLALHFGTALLLLYLLWVQILCLWPYSREMFRQYFTPLHQRLLPHLYAAFALVILTLLYGAFVAGLDAGLIYNEFPLMGGKFVPGEWLFHHPWWSNFLHNHATVQWMHRVLGTVTFIVLFALGLRAVWSRNSVLQHLGYALCGVILLQYILGIVTLLTHVQIHAATAHQAGAVLTVLMLGAMRVFLRGPAAFAVHLHGAAAR